MITQVGQITPEDLLALRQVLLGAPWEHVTDEERDYLTWHGVMKELSDIPGLLALWPRSWWCQAFFLRLAPNGKVHRHVDTKDVYDSFHIPVYTHNEATCYMEVNGVAVAHHLEHGKVYLYDRTKPHWSENVGRSDRVHLIMEIYKKEFRK
jgi:hypothetical protein